MIDVGAVGNTVRAMCSVKKSILPNIYANASVEDLRQDHFPITPATWLPIRHLHFACGRINDAGCHGIYSQIFFIFSPGVPADGPGNVIMVGEYFSKASNIPLPAR